MKRSFDARVMRCERCFLQGEPADHFSECCSQSSRQSGNAPAAGRRRISRHGVNKPAQEFVERFRMRRQGGRPRRYLPRHFV